MASVRFLFCLEKNRSFFSKTLHYWSLGDYGIKKADGSSYYYLKDHVGSIRVVVDSSGVEKIVEGYYPFGMQQPGRSINRSLEDSNRKFNAKIKDENLGLDWLYYGARYYDPKIAIWPGVDPFRQSMSPYSFSGNNPVVFVDENGQAFWIPVLIGAVIGGYAGGAIKNDHGNPFRWEWNKDTWSGIGTGAAIGAFIGSGIGAGGAYGTAVGTSTVDTYMVYLSGVDPNDLWKHALAGFVTGYFGATGGFGLAKKGIMGRFATQMISTSSRSIGRNWAEGQKGWEVFNSFQGRPVRISSRAKTFTC